MSDISYHIHGSDLQFVEVTLPPNSSVIGEQGAMMYMDDHLQVDTVLGDGSNSSFGAVAVFPKRLNGLLRVSRCLAVVISILCKRAACCFRRTHLR